jgi:heptaprenyl diphosphate synthase
MEDYFKRIKKKTGILISSCSKAGAAAAGASDYHIGIMDNYGMNIGNAYQIIDDILDFTGDKTKLGKPTGMDLLNGNITLPVIILMEDPKYGPSAAKIIRSGNLTRHDIDNITEMLVNSGAIKKCYSIAEECIDKAKQNLSNVMESPYKSMLIYMADKVVNRDC